MSDQPPWNQLPHDPLGFFGLPAEFDRRDLKRAYRDLVRRFKPDRAPDEFQRIRAAYEELAAILASGARQPTAPEPLAAADSADIEGGPRAAEEAYRAILDLHLRGEHSQFWSALLDALDRFPETPPAS